MSLIMDVVALDILGNVSIVISNDFNKRCVL